MYNSGLRYNSGAVYNSLPISILVADHFEITAELWDYLEANRDEIKLYELVEGQLCKMTQEEYDLKNPVQVIVTE